MKLSKERVRIIARDLVKGLTDHHFIALDMHESELASKISQIITEDLMVEERLEAEVRQILKSYESEIQRGNADFHKMFLMIKKKLAKERGIIL
ncbi:MAG: DUF507 family protein [Nitrospira sp.]|nr:DUF507 family protein [Nitrospira sp.]